MRELRNRFLIWWQCRTALADGFLVHASTNCAVNDCDMPLTWWQFVVWGQCPLHRDGLLDR